MTLRNPLWQLGGRGGGGGGGGAGEKGQGDKITQVYSELCAATVTCEKAHSGGVENCPSILISYNCIGHKCP